jgi:hypothetical protein
MSCLPLRIAILSHDSKPSKDKNLMQDKVKATGAKILAVEQDYKKQRA